MKKKKQKTCWLFFKLKKKIDLCLFHFFSCIFLHKLFSVGTTKSFSIRNVIIWRPWEPGFLGKQTRLKISRLHFVGHRFIWNWISLDALNVSYVCFTTIKTIISIKSYFERTYKKLHFFLLIEFQKKNNCLNRIYLQNTEI